MSSWPSTSLAGADAEHRDGQLGADEGGHLGRHGLEEQELDAGLVQSAGVFDHELRRLERAALGLVAAELTGALRREADVAADDDAGVEDRLDAGQDADAALELDGVDAGLLRKRPALRTASSSETW